MDIYIYLLAARTYYTQTQFHFSSYSLLHIFFFLYKHIRTELKQDSRLKHTKRALNLCERHFLILLLYSVVYGSFAWAKKRQKASVSEADVVEPITPLMAVSGSNVSKFDISKSNI